MAARTKTPHKDEPKTPRQVEHGARTAGEGAKTGLTTAGAGVKQFGDATAGLVEGGSGVRAMNALRRRRVLHGAGLVVE